MGSYFSRSWSCDKGHKAVTPLSDGRVLVITVSPQIKAYSPLSRPYLITALILVTLENIWKLQAKNAAEENKSDLLSIYNELLAKVTTSALGV